MDALDLLEQQHRALVELFDRVATAESPGRRTALVAGLVRAVEAHSRVEESVFYAAFSERIAGEQARLYEGFEDHALMRFAAVNLLRTRATDVRFSARLKQVQRLFRRHAAAEESWMFPKAKRALHDEALDRIGLEIERAHAARISVDPVRLERRCLRRRAERAPAAHGRGAGRGGVGAGGPRLLKPAH
jgi:hemerythrin superfamily protein